MRMHNCTVHKGQTERGKVYVYRLYERVEGLRVSGALPSLVVNLNRFPEVILCLEEQSRSGEKKVDLFL